ncbi:hypothetical protein F503_04725 [Ophiostoma piceae UAMH 11346]|uniref:Uncharacterized protein n=1 Tax=Ophiostoma piceae (strain UAMH 11346) TaxID=1262450 RepID=S3CU60_OPHP1|nr:hypothetical protein F503_04725 [Ophiostoma piceae UAMH 11346]
MRPKDHTQLHPTNRKCSKLEQHTRHPIPLGEDPVLQPRYPISKKRQLHGAKTVSRAALRRLAAHEKAMQEQVERERDIQDSLQGLSLDVKNTDSSPTIGELDPNLRGGNGSPQQTCPVNEPVLHLVIPTELPLRPAVPRRIAKLDRDRNRGRRRQRVSLGVESPYIAHPRGTGPDEQSLWADTNSDPNINYTLASGSPATLPHDAQTPRGAMQPRGTEWRRCLPPWEIPVLSWMAF